ncbi:MAG: T9SS type A sorting domain-containing protein [Bacteroidia bacterium]|nr:T9SS type A sorting domain-containing protein [Bacteroidia bacterium]
MKKLVLILAIALFSTQIKAQTTLTTAVDFNVVTVHGDSVNLFDILDGGQHVLLDFFFTTCGPCIASIPDLNTIYTDYGCNSADIFMVSIDDGDTHQEVINYENQYGALIPAVSGTDGGGTQINNAYNINAWPTIILIAPNRQIIEQDIWPFSASIASTKFTQAGIMPAACPAVGIEESGIFSELIAFPNPVSDLLNIAFDIKENSVVQFELIDVSGKLIRSEASHFYNAGQHTMNISTSDIASGFYFLNILVDGKNSTQRKISIVH